MILQSYGSGILGGAPPQENLGSATGLCSPRDYF